MSSIEKAPGTLRWATQKFLARMWYRLDNLRFRVAHFSIAWNRDALTLSMKDDLLTALAENEYPASWFDSFVAIHSGAVTLLDQGHLKTWYEYYTRARLELNWRSMVTSEFMCVRHPRTKVMAALFSLCSIYKLDYANAIQILSHRPSDVDIQGSVNRHLYDILLLDKQSHMDEREWRAYQIKVEDEKVSLDEDVMSEPVTSNKLLHFLVENEIYKVDLDEFMCKAD